MEKKLFYVHQLEERQKELQKQQEKKLKLYIGS